LDVTGAQINDNNTFIGGVAHSMYPLVRGMYNKREDKIDAFGWKNEFNVGTPVWSRTSVIPRQREG
jgi:hypothetical protein